MRVSALGADWLTLSGLMVHNAARNHPGVTGAGLDRPFGANWLGFLKSAWSAESADTLSDLQKID